MHKNKCKKLSLLLLLRTEIFIIFIFIISKPIIFSRFLLAICHKTKRNWEHPICGAFSYFTNLCFSGIHISSYSSLTQICASLHKFLQELVPRGKWFGEFLSYAQISYQFGRRKTFGALTLYGIVNIILPSRFFDFVCLNAFALNL